MQAKTHQTRGINCRQTENLRDGRTVQTESHTQSIDGQGEKYRHMYNITEVTATDPCGISVPWSCTSPSGARCLVVPGDGGQGGSACRSAPPS